MNREEKVLSLLKKYYGNPKTILNYSNEWELLVAVILSAQCTDVTVNKVTSKLFPKYRHSGLSRIRSWSRSAPQDDNKNITPEVQEIINFAGVPLVELEQDIRSTGFYKNKAKNVRASAQLIIEQFNGVLPRTMAEMITIPGAARKTANVVLGNAFGIVEGIAVDTHVRRLSQRLGFTNHNDPNKIEQDLMLLFEKKDWFGLTYLLIEHGRKICEAKKPKCDLCFLNKLCPSAYQFPQFKK